MGIDRNILVIFCVFSRAEQLQTLANICKELRGMKYFKLKGNFTSESIYNTIKDVAPDLKYTIKTCRWQQKKIDCSKYITPVFTSYGLCFAFNILNSCETYTKYVCVINLLRNNNN